MAEDRVFQALKGWFLFLISLLQARMKKEGEGLIPKSEIDAFEECFSEIDKKIYGPSLAKARTARTHKAIQELIYIAIKALSKEMSKATPEELDRLSSLMDTYKKAIKTEEESGE